MKTGGKSLVGLLLLAVAPAAFALTNLVKNPGFETGSIMFWRADSRLGSVTTDARTGTKGLKLPSETEHVTMSQDIPVMGGKVYTISAWIKQTTATGKGASYIFYWYMDKSGGALHNQFIKHLEGTFGWTETKVNSLAPENAATLRLMLYVSVEAGGSVTGYFDDVSVVEGEYMTSKANILTNPGFENGTNGWSNTGSTKTTSSAVVRSGSSALKIVGNGGYDHVYQEVPAAPGDAFSFIGYSCLRTANGDSVTTTGWSCFQFEYMDANNASIWGFLDIDYRKDYSWKRWGKDILTAPAGTAKIRIEAWTGVTSNIGYYDDTYLAKLTKNPNPPSITLRPMRSVAQHGKSVTFYDAMGRKILPLSSKRPSLGVYFADREGKWTLTRDAKK